MSGGGKNSHKVAQIIVKEKSLVTTSMDNATSQDLLKDFLDKKDKGELMIQKASNLLKTILKEVKPTTGSINLLCVA